MRALKARNLFDPVLARDAVDVDDLTAPRAGAAHLARIAAAENAAHGIRVNAIAPGGVDTAIWESSPDFRKSAAEQGREATIAAMGAMSPRGRFATADEIAGEIAFLLSDLAGNVTGTVHVTDGGYSL